MSDRKIVYYETKHGFKFGDATVKRVTSYGENGVILCIETSKERLDVRITPTGFIKLDSPITKV